jgi:hypothetical protein
MSALVINALLTVVQPLLALAFTFVFVILPLLILTELVVTSKLVVVSELTLLLVISELTLLLISKARISAETDLIRIPAKLIIPAELIFLLITELIFLLTSELT